MEAFLSRDASKTVVLECLKFTHLGNLTQESPQTIARYNRKPYAPASRLHLGSAKSTLESMN